MYNRYIIYRSGGNFFLSKQLAISYYNVRIPLHTLQCMGDRKCRCICFFLTFLYFMSIRLQGNIWRYNIFNVRAISGIYKYNIVVSFSVKTTFQTTGLVIDGPVYSGGVRVPSETGARGSIDPARHRRRGVIKPCFVVHINIVAFNTGAWSVSSYLYSLGDLYFCKHRLFIS